MNRVISFYRRFGKATDKVMNKLSFSPVFKGVPVPFKQTPGRAQYYYTETLHLVPENILYQIKMPTRFAMSQSSKKYDDVVEAEVTKYLQKKIPFNLYSPKDGVTLDMTVAQA